jgi:hypothetical protein
MVSGYVVELTHSFFSAFVIASGFLIVAVLSYWFVVGKPAQIFDNEDKMVGSPLGV